MILAGIGFPIVWGVLGGSMPRSGGEYIYNSRIIHPIIGIGESFGNAFVWIMWIYVLAPWMADPGMVMMSQFMNWTWLYDPATSTFFGGLSYTGVPSSSPPSPTSSPSCSSCSASSGSRASRRSS